MHRLETRRGLLHKLHHTALRETLAAEVAAANLYEYDGLPWSFYLDMAQQVEDEARHAIIAADMLHRLGGYLGQFPVPHFGNFYHLFWGMTLPERLIAMNLDTEAAARNYLREATRRLHTIRSSVARLYAFIGQDERQHGMMGARWLVYLIPDRKARVRAIDAARAFTVIHLAAAHAQVAGGSPLDALQRWSQGVSPIRFADRRSKAYESEVYLSTARVSGSGNVEGRAESL